MKKKDLRQKDRHLKKSVKERALQKKRKKKEQNKGIVTIAKK